MSEDRSAAERRLATLMALRPRSAQELHRFVRVTLGLDVARTALGEGSAAPFDYLCDAFFEDGSAADIVVWAARGSGKTLLGAVATMLDLLFKPGVQVRILGGSLVQSSRMYEHLVALAGRELLRPVLAGEPTRTRIELVHGSRAEILAQSQRSVRGVRVHKLRCDEVDEFDPDVWEAAQLVTRSGRCGDVHVRGRVEALSTMHRPFGLMARLVGGADEAYETHNAQPQAAAGKPVRVYRWNYLDVIERCPPQRDCGACVLYSDCQGRAKQADGFVSVDDLVAQWHRTSRQTWAAEMVCDRPRRSDSVYPGFDPASHVAAPADDGRDALWVGGMDFGLRSPLVMLWAQVRDDALHVVDEYVETGRTLTEHLSLIQRQAATRDHGEPAWLGVDPAGRQRNSHSGRSDVHVLREHGYRVRAQSSTIREGIERVRCRLDRGTLRLHPRCTRLIEAMQSYHFDPRRPERDEPIKDGPDHACDALRYMVVNLERGSGRVDVRRWA